jgi:hypothetical protein
MVEVRRREVRVARCFEVKGTRGRIVIRFTGRGSKSYDYAMKK